MECVVILETVQAGLCALEAVREARDGAAHWPGQPSHASLQGGHFPIQREGKCLKAGLQEQRPGPLLKGWQVHRGKLLMTFSKCIMHIVNA